eukprot:TRINITY_DN457_c0_g1_i1.p1 TRINITY_DN457_c0_g1~~TRINITY_DN457_c0_g1_i1.p1  ORF type:complete len:162 (-),score=74.18 TRINITY_DN457_c0_g1_i1:94-558(-)
MSAADIDLHAPKIAEALFFPTNGDIKRMLQFLKACKKSLDICVFNITDDRIASQILKLHKKGIKIRVITDDDCSTTQGSDINSLSKSGIPVKMDNSTAHMHHKFAILDGVVLMSGSFNWTRSASAQNNENMFFINEKLLVQPFITEFGRLWEGF